MLRVGLIGLGGIGRHHLSRYSQVPCAEVVAVADVRSDDLQGDTSLGALFERPSQEIRWFADYRDLVASGSVDAVDICLPTFLHPEAAITALDGGLHVLCEKPMALTLEACDIMLAAAKRSDKQLMIAHCIRFWPEYRYLMDLLQNQKAGRLLSLQLSRQGQHPSGANSGWMGRRDRSGGAILDLHIHDVDFAQALLGIPERIYAQGGMSRGQDAGYDYVLSNLVYGDGQQVSATAHWTDAPLPFSAFFEARFEHAFIRYDRRQDPSFIVYDEGAAEPRTPTFENPDAYVNEIRYFAERALANEPPAHCRAIEARNSVGLVLSEAASIECGEIVLTKDFVI